MTRELLLSYVEQQIALGCLETWNVALMSKAKRADDATIDLGLPDPVPCIVRTRLKIDDETVAGIGTLMSRPDRVVDLDVRGSSLTDRDMQRARDRIGRPLIALYAINADSKVTEARKKYRQNLDAKGHLIAVGFSFPNDHPDTPFGGSVIHLGEEFLEAMEQDLVGTITEQDGPRVYSSDGEGDFMAEARP